MFGLSAGIIGSALAFVGEAGAAPMTGQQLGAVKAGGVIRLGIPTPSSPVEPYLLNDDVRWRSPASRVIMMFTTPQAQVRPMPATSWKPNKTVTVWTFQLRRGVRFPTARRCIGGRGRVDEAVCRQGIERGLQPLLRSFRRFGRGTVRGPLPAEGAARHVPVSLSQTTYQAMIQPASIAAQPGTWLKSGMIGTGLSSSRTTPRRRTLTKSATTRTGAVGLRSTA